MTTAFAHLFQPLQIRGCTLKNRIMSTGHDTTLPTDGMVNEALVAYQEARARGGVGLIVLQVSGVHETARYTNHVLMATDDASIPGYRRVAEMAHGYGTVVFAQLFHPGREIAEADRQVAHFDGVVFLAHASAPRLRKSSSKVRTFSWCSRSRGANRNSASGSAPRRPRVATSSTSTRRASRPASEESGACSTTPRW